jgi:TPR repeat protein
LAEVQAFGQPGEIAKLLGRSANWRLVYSPFVRYRGTSTAEISYDRVVIIRDSDGSLRRQIVSEKERISRKYVVDVCFSKSTSLSEDQIVLLQAENGDVDLEALESTGLTGVEIDRAAVEVEKGDFLRKRGEGSLMAALGDALKQQTDQGIQNIQINDLRYSIDQETAYLAAHWACGYQYEGVRYLVLIGTKRPEIIGQPLGTERETRVWKSAFPVLMNGANVLLTRYDPLAVAAEQAKTRVGAVIGAGIVGFVICLLLDGPLSKAGPVAFLVLAAFVIQSRLGGAMEVKAAAQGDSEDLRRVFAGFRLDEDGFAIDGKLAEFARFRETKLAGFETTIQQTIKRCWYGLAVVAAYLVAVAFVFHGENQDTSSRGASSGFSAPQTSTSADAQGQTAYSSPSTTVAQPPGPAVRPADSGNTGVAGDTPAARAFDAFKRKDFDGMLRILQSASDGGNPAVELKLGEAFQFGLGTAPNFDIAVAWYRRAADHGNTLAMDRLGAMYRNGIGVQKDQSSAIQWWLKAAAGGDGFAEYELANIYKNGAGLPQDIPKAIALYESSARKNVLSSYSYLGAIYRKGELVPKDLDKALANYRAAAEMGFENAEYRLALAYRDGEGVPQDIEEAYKWAYISTDIGNQPEPRGLRDRLSKQITSDRLANLNTIAGQMARSFAAKGTALADEQTVESWGLGIGASAIQPNPQPTAPASAEGNTIVAASQADASSPPDSSPSQNAQKAIAPPDESVARAYNDGAAFFDKQFYTLALDRYRYAARQGYAPAQNRLGYLWEHGYGVSVNYQLAKSWYLKSAAQGYDRAEYNLGMLFKTGKGVPTDYGQAMHWLRAAADQGYAPAQYEVGQLFLSGLGVLRDATKAQHWIGSAAGQGYPETWRHP